MLAANSSNHIDIYPHLETDFLVFLVSLNFDLILLCEANNRLVVGIVLLLLYHE
jgi:hypothetical protein